MDEILKYYSIESLQELVHQVLAPIGEPFKWTHSRQGDSVSFTIFKEDKAIGGINIYPQLVLRDRLRLEHWINENAELIAQTEMKVIWMNVHNYFFSQHYRFIFSDEFRRYLDFGTATSSAAEASKAERAEHPARAELKDKIVEKWREGLSLREISESIPLPLSTLKIIRDELIYEGRLPPEAKRKRKKKPNPDSI